MTKIIILLTYILSFIHVIQSASFSESNTILCYLICPFSLTAISNYDNILASNMNSNFGKCPGRLIIHDVFISFHMTISIRWCPLMAQWRRFDGVLCETFSDDTCGIIGVSTDNLRSKSAFLAPSGQVKNFPMSSLFFSRISSAR